MYLPQTCFPRVLPISRLVTQAPYWKDSGGLHFPWKPGNPHFYVFISLATQCTKLPGKPEAEIVAQFWPVWALGWERPVTGGSPIPPPVSVGVVPGGTNVILERKSIFLISPPKRISIKMSFQVFTVNLLIPFCFWHQTTNLQPLKWMVRSVSHEFLLTDDKSCPLHTST